MRFCSKCRNLMRFKLAEVGDGAAAAAAGGGGGASGRVMQYECTTCGEVEDAALDNNLIQEHNVKASAATAKVSKQAWEDPTVPVTNLVRCVNPECTRGPKEEVQTQQIKTNPAAMRFTQRCMHCATVWTQQ